MNAQLFSRVVFCTFYLSVNLISTNIHADDSSTLDSASVITKENGILLEINNPESAKEKQRATLIRLLYASVSTKNSKYNILKADALDILSTYPNAVKREALLNEALQGLENISGLIAVGEFADLCKSHQCTYLGEVGYVQSPSGLFSYASTGNVFASQILFDTITSPWY